MPTLHTQTTHHELNKTLLHINSTSDFQLESHWIFFYSLHVTQRLYQTNKRAQ